MFAAVEAERQQGQTTGSTALPFVYHYRYDNPKWYGKLDWNITDSNILELTSVSQKVEYQGVLNKFSYPKLTEGGFNSNDTHTKNGADVYSAKFTSYITDDLTLSALYGKMKGTWYSFADYDPTNPYLFTPENQNPDLNSGRTTTNNQGVSTTDLPRQVEQHQPAYRSELQDRRSHADGSVSTTRIRRTSTAAPNSRTVASAMRGNTTSIRTVIRIRRRASTSWAVRERPQPGADWRNSPMGQCRPPVTLVARVAITSTKYEYPQ